MARQSRREGGGARLRRSADRAVLRNHQTMRSPGRAANTFQEPTIWKAFALTGSAPPAHGVYLNQPSPMADKVGGIWAKLRADARAADRPGDLLRDLQPQGNRVSQLAILRKRADRASRASSPEISISRAARPRSKSPSTPTWTTTGPISISLWSTKTPARLSISAAKSATTRRR